MSGPPTPKDDDAIFQVVRPENIDFIADREEQIFLLEQLTTAKFPKQGNKAAEWRLRCKRHTAINNELQKLGVLAQLLCGSMLVTYDNGLNQLERFSRWRETLEESPMMREMNPVQRSQLYGAKTKNWTRLELSFHALGNCLCLAAKDLNDPSILHSANILKVSLIKRSFASDRTLDESIDYIKWLGKSCQYVFLRAQVPQFEAFDPILDHQGNIAPFAGELSYISDLIKSGARRKTSLSFEHARKLAQIGNTPRALPYPSFDQTKVDVQRTIDTFRSEFRPKTEAVIRYRAGLDTFLDRFGKANRDQNHVSISTSSKYENARSTGGGSLLLIALTRQYTDQILTEEILTDLTGRYSQFGQLLIDPSTAELARPYLQPKEGYFPPTVGDILFLEVQEITKVWTNTLKLEKRTPPKLGQILTLTASAMILEVGHYDPPCELRHKVLTFGTTSTEFIPVVDKLPVRAGISIEAGLKSRITTAGLTAFAHLSQLTANYMRDYLSKDPFHRVGFQESDKLWEVLKTYKDRYEADQLHNA